MEILRLQSEVDNVQKLMAKGRKISELRITGETLQLHQICKHTQLICCFLSFFFFFNVTEIRTTLDNLKKRQLLLQKQLEEADYIQAQMSKAQRHE